MAETRGRDGEAIEVKSEECGRGVPSRWGGGVRGPSPDFFLKKWCDLVHSEKKKRKKKEDNRSNKIYRNEVST